MNDINLKFLVSIFSLWHHHTRAASIDKTHSCRLACIVFIREILKNVDFSQGFTTRKARLG